MLTVSLSPTELRDLYMKYSQIEVWGYLSGIVPLSEEIVQSEVLALHDRSTSQAKALEAVVNLKTHSGPYVVSILVSPVGTI